MKKRYNLLTVLLLITVNIVGQNPSFEWLKTMGGTDRDWGADICTDDSDNIYITGYFSGTSDFGLGGTPQLLNSQGSWDIFVQKIDFEGNLVWVMSIGGSNAEFAQGIVKDTFGNIYVCGAFMDSVDFDPGPGVSSIVSHGNFDLFLLKLDPNGNFLWVKSIGGVENDYGRDITIDDSGNILLIGDYTGTVDIDPSIGTEYHTAKGFSDCLIVKLTSNGNFIWGKTYGGQHIDGMSSIVTDSIGNLYLTGYFRETVDFDPNIGISNRVSNGHADYFIQKLDSNGNFCWVKSAGGIASDNASSITKDEYGNLLIAGEFYGTADLNYGSSLASNTTMGDWDGFVQKMDMSGNVIWTKTLEDTLTVDVNKIISDKCGNIYVSGTYKGNIDVDPSSSTHILSAMGNYDAFILKLNSSGNYLWAESMGGNSADYNSSMCVDNYNDLYQLGFFSNTLLVNCGFTTPVSAGLQDIFIKKHKTSLRGLLGKDTTLCQNDTVLLNALTPNATYIWQDSSSAPFYVVSQPGTYYVEVKTNSCPSTDTIKINYNPNPKLNLGNDTNICLGDTLILDAFILGATYRWQDSSIFHSYEITNEGQYSLEIELNNCINTDTINVNVETMPKASLIDDTLLCEGESLILSSNNQNCTYRWQDGSIDSIYEVKHSDLYWIEVTNQCGIAKASVRIDFEDCNCNIHIPNAFSPNSDGINDLFFVNHTCEFDYFNYYIYNRWGELIFTSKEPNSAWDGTKNGNKCSEDVYVIIYEYKVTNEEKQRKAGKVVLFY